MRSQNLLDVIKIASAYAGTIIGAGFASGQELLQFFVVYGTVGFGGIILAGILFAWLGYRILELGHRLNATGYHQLLYYACGKKAALFLDSIITVFLFSVLTIMLSGTGTMFQDHFHLPYSLGTGVIGILAFCTVLYGIRGITVMNMGMLPLLTLSTLSVGIYSLAYHGLSTDMLVNVVPYDPQNGSHWLIASILYVSYNLIIGSTVLAPLGPHIRSRKLRFWGSIAGGFLITILAGFIAIIVMIHCPDILNYEIPMLHIAGMQHKINSTSYVCMFLIAMYTTAATTLYACAGQLSHVTKLSFPLCSLIIIATGMLCSQLGFSVLISWVFPAVGYLALYFIVRLGYLAFLSK
ncbi:putative membrane protein [Propionispora sp. 2/2-37]|uniref:YkvI family membrane protein n=1 Tax=Propionispora sp. 2/2-37 TaxID=1677858 RepID=UPI0006BB6987|nr:hypothetical protein [Propionispora sp. 2/2-37]CUH95437.1 putative membrane protein [Propionispora sp. 2/2-37]